MTTTPNLGLTKDAPTDQYSVERVNANSDRIDEFAGDVNDALAGKQAALTFDQTPTEDSANPVTSGGVYDAMHAQSDEISALANIGAKNALHVIDFRSGTSHIPGPVTNRGVTYTINADGTVTADGTSDPEESSASSCQIWCEVARSGNYTFTCGANSATVSVDPDSLYDCFLGTQVGSAYTTLIRDFYSDEEQVKNTAYLEAGVPYRLNIRVHIGKTVDNEVFKPMLRPVALTDTTFVPYAPSNRELYELIEALTARVEALENA